MGDQFEVDLPENESFSSFKEQFMNLLVNKQILTREAIVSVNISNNSKYAISVLKKSDHEF